MEERDGAYVDATGPACVRRHKLWSRPDQEAHEGIDGAADETLATHFWQNCGADVHAY